VNKTVRPLMISTLKILLHLSIFASTTLVLLQACGKSSDILTALEEQKALMGYGKDLEPLLTRVKSARELFTQETITLNFNNEKKGDDEGMKYTCEFDLTIDETLTNGQACDSLPNDPATKFNVKTGELSWGPIATVGTYEFRVTGENSGGKDSVIFAIKVVENKIPVLTRIRDQITDANRTFILAAVNENPSTNPEPVFSCFFDTTVDNAVEQKEANACDLLPGGAAKKFNTKNGSLSWTPPNSAVGTYELTIKVENDAGSDQQTFALVVGADPNLPVLTKVDSQYTVYVGSTFSLDFNNERSGGDKDMSYACRFDTNVDGKVPGARDCDSLPNGSDIKFIPEQGRLTWGPILSEGSYELKVVGENIAGRSEQIFVVRVVTNRMPVLAKIRDQRINSNRTFTLTGSNTNTDATIGLSYSCTFDRVLDGVVSNGVSCETLLGPPATKLNYATGVFTWTPSNAAIGSYEFNLRATNSSGSSDQVFAVIVDPDPDTPVLTKVTNMYAYLGDSINLDLKNEKTGNDTGMTYACYFDSTVDGVVGDVRDCNQLADAPVNKFSSSAGTLSWGPLLTTGIYEIKLRGQNIAGLDEEIIVVNVQRSQSPRLARILDKQMEANQTLLITPVNSNSLQGDRVTYSCTFDSNIDGLVANGNLCRLLPGQPSVKFDVDTGVLNWIPDNTMTGSYEFKIRAENSFGFDEKIFVLVVSPSTERKVSLAYIRNVAVVTGETVSVDAINTLTSSDTGVTYSCYYDAVVDGVVADTLSCDLLTGSPAQKFNPTTGALNWVPSFQAQTELEIKIVGTKQGDSDAKSFVVSFATSRFGDVGNSAIVFDPNSWDFGSVAVGSAAVDKSITLTNNSSSSIYISQITSSNADFVLNFNACPAPTAAFASQATCVINIGFHPSTSNQLGAALTIRFGKTANSTDYSSVMGLSGRGVGTLTFAGLQSISNVTHNSLKLNWTASAQAASYLIFQIVSGNMVYLETIVNTGGTVNSKTYTHLNPSTAYTYRVRATDFVGVVDSNTNNVSATTLANTAPVISSGPGAWLVYTGKVISPNLDFYDSSTNGDSDADGDAITYACTFDNNIDGSVVDGASSCSTITNIDGSSYLSFNTFSGILSAWKPAIASLGVAFEFKITATDQYGASSSTIFSTTVQNGTPQITGVSDYTFPNAYKRVGDTLALDFDNVRFAASDTDMTYTCTYKTLTTSDSSASACSGLPGTFTLSSSTGALSWALTSASIGAYSLTVTGTNLVGSHSRTFKVSVIPGIDEAQRIFHLDARHAYDSRGGQNSIGTTTYWGDILNSPSSTTFGNLTNFNTAAAWVGSTSASNPMAISFDGTDDYVNFSSSTFNTGALHFDAWVYQGVNAREKVIFSNGNSSNQGLIVTDRRMWLGNGSNTAYRTAVLEDSPRIYWELSDISGGTAIDSSGNGNTGLIVNPSQLTSVDDGVFNLSGAGVQSTGTGYVRPLSTYTLGSTWTIESWFNYPFVGACSNGGWCTLARSNTSGDHQILIQQGTLLLGVWKNKTAVPTPANGFLSTGYSVQALSRGWHHLAVTGSGGQTKFYVDGTLVGTVSNYQPVDDLYFVGSMGSQPFGKIDEFAVYNTALSPARILAHYNAGYAGYCSYTMNDGFWYHLTGTMDDTSNNATLYLNGSQICSFTKNGSSTLAGSTTGLTVGRSSLGTATSWLGKLSSLIFYNDASTGNITSNYTATSSLYSPQLAVPPAGLRLWLRADQGLYQDSARSMPATLNNDPVIAWEDQSGNGGDVTVKANLNQTTARPTLKLNTLNGKPVVSFDGNDELQNTIAYSIPNTIFIVAHYNGATRGRILSGMNNNWLMGWHGGFWDRFYANGWVHAPTPATDNSWQIYATDHATSLQRIFRNNQFLNSATVAGAQAPNGLEIGTGYGASEWSQAEVAEIIIYDRVLSNSERQAIFNYLNARYAVY